MNHFYLLRNNREAGPFSRAELKSHGLLSTDLLWVDGTSKEWKHPADIDGLEMTFSDETKRYPSTVKKDPAPVVLTSRALPQLLTYADEIFTLPMAPVSSNTYTSATVFQKKKSNAAVYTVGAQLFGVVVVLIGLLLCGFVVVNMMKQFAAKPATASQAVLINAETLPPSNTAHTAQGPQPQKILPLASVGQAKDSSQTEAKLLKNQLKTLAEAKASKAKVKPAHPAPESMQYGQAIDANEQASTEVPEEKPEPVKAVSPLSLQLSANDYKVGFFGGISNLEITVANPSGQTVSKAVVEIEYLKPNGNVVKTQSVTAENIASGGSKIIHVPSSGRGVKVRYRVVSIE